MFENHQNCLIFPPKIFLMLFKSNIWIFEPKTSLDSAWNDTFVGDFPTPCKECKSSNFVSLNGILKNHPFCHYLELLCPPPLESISCIITVENKCYDYWKWSCYRMTLIATLSSWLHRMKPQSLTFSFTWSKITPKNAISLKFGTVGSKCVWMF